MKQSLTIFILYVLFISESFIISVRVKQAYNLENKLKDVTNEFEKVKKELESAKICDTAEAAGRAVNPDTREKLDELIGGLIKEKLDHGQFDECNITMRDLSIIRDTICDVLPSVNHARIKYKK